MPKVQMTATFALTALCEPGKRKTDYWDTITSGLRAGGPLIWRTNLLPPLLRRARPATAVKDRWLCGHLLRPGRQSSQAPSIRGCARRRSVGRQGGEESRSDLCCLGRAAPGSSKGLPTKLAVNRGAPPSSSGAALGQASAGRDPATGRRSVAGRKGGGGLAPASVEKSRVTFGRSFELARQWEMPGAATNPVRSVPRPKFDNKRERFLTREQAGLTKQANA